MYFTDYQRKQALTYVQENRLDKRILMVKGVVLVDSGIDSESDGG